MKNNKGMKNMKKILKNNNICILLLSLITTIGISVNLIENEFRFSGNDFKWLIVLTVLFVFFKYVFKNIERRRIKISCLLGLILAIFYLLGYMAQNEFAISKKMIILLIFKFEVYFVLITAIINLLYENVNKWRKLEKKKTSNKEYKFFSANKKSILFVALLLILIYLPYILNYFPGNVLIDSTVQILQGQGDLEFTNHHPVLHTMCIKTCIDIGYGLTGSYQFGVALYTIIQTVLTAFVFSYAIYYMAKKKVPLAARICALIFFALCPTIGFYTITMYKDIPFALLMLIVTIGIIEMVTNTDEFMSSKKKIALLSICILLAMFFRNNGIYAFILAFPFFLIAMKKYWKKILIIFLLPIILYEIITNPIYNWIGIKKGSSREALTIPIQQFARLMIYKNDELTDVQKDKIKEYLPIDNFKDLYNPVFADPIKSNFSEEAFEKDKIGLIKLYFELAIKFPGETIKSFILGNYGYYYPNVVGWGVYTGVNTESFDGMQKYDIKTTPIIKLQILDKINNFVNNRDFPIISMILSIGFLFWILLICMGYCVYEKLYLKLLIFIPVLFVWVTVLASPVFAEPRYVYCLFTTIPIFIVTTVFLKKNKNENFKV